MAGAPSFTSFPNIIDATSKKTAASREHSESPDPKRSGARERDDRNPAKRYKGKERERDSHRSEKGRRKDHDVERRYERDERRRRERQRAEDLREDSQKYDERDQKLARYKKNQELQWKELEDGVPWYETSQKTRERGVYEDTFEPTSNTAFYTDTVGDKDTMRYGSLSSHAAPRYYRDGHGRILGLNEGLRVVHSRDRTERGIELAPRGRSYIPRYSARTLESSSSHLRRLVLRPGPSGDFDPFDPFISFDLPRKRINDGEQSYRDISGTVQEGEDDLTIEQEVLSGFSSMEQDIRYQTTETERYLKDHPEDIGKWIMYSTLHLRLSPDSHKNPKAGVDISKQPQTRAIAEVTLSILTRALKHGSNFTSIPLHLAYLHTAEAFWPPNKVTSRWKNVIRELGEKANQGHNELGRSMIDLWLGYLQWRESQGLGKQEENQTVVGTVDDVLDIYAECLGQMQISADDDDMLLTNEENLLYIFLRCCLFMRQAGYTEKAYACFQSLIEITLFKPNHLRPPAHPSPSWFPQLLTEYESFWESEAPRIGEKDAKGWKNTSETSIPEASEHTLEPTALDPFEQWREAEDDAERHNQLPGRTTDLDLADDEDPHRVVLFDDIKPFLTPIRSPEVRLQLVYAFLSFIGVSVASPDSPTTAKSATDPSLRWSLTNNGAARAAFWPRKIGARRLPWQTVGGEPMQPEDGRPMDNPFSCPIKCWSLSNDTLFAQTDHWFREMSTVDLEHLDVKVVRNVFRTLRPLVPDPAFTLISLAFEAAVAPKAAVKVAKSILSIDRENLLIWGAYARIERQRGNISAARTVYATAIQAAHSQAGGTSEKLAVWSAWAEMEWENAEMSRCLEVLVMAAGEQLDRINVVAGPDYEEWQPSSVARLKAAQYYASFPLPASFNQLLIMSLHGYVTSGIDKVQSVIFSQISKLKSGSNEAEEAFQLLGRILHIHTSRHPSPASLIRHALELAIASFPSNTQLLSLYLYSESTSRVYGRIYHLISDLASNEQANIVGHLWSIWAEATTANRTFWDAGGGGTERVRNALDRAVNSSSASRSPAVWMLYIEYEALMGKSNSAKQLCYRAVAAIGGCKALYLLPFSPKLRKHFSDRELREWACLMVERGIRLRIPFETYFDPTIHEEVMVLPEDEELQDDELAFLRDREELKPY